MITPDLSSLPATPAEAEKDRAPELGVASGSAFWWRCDDCRESGAVTIDFPCHPDCVSEAVRREHVKAERRRHCMCPAHYMKTGPLNDLNAPVAELCGTLPLVLYFGNEADREEFVALMRQTKPGMRTRAF